MNNKTNSDYHKQAYLWVSFALAIPVFLWPSFLLLGLTPAFGVSIEQNWAVAASCLLISAIVADSILSYSQKPMHVIISAIWIITASYIISLVMRKPEMIWFIPALFALRTLHPFYPLWHRQTQTQQWWVWISWWRDSSTALVMFLWLCFWPQ